MSKKIYFKTLQKWVDEACEEYDRLFVPSDLDEAIGKRLIKFTDSDILRDCVYEYARSNKGVFLIQEFAVKFSEIQEIVEKESNLKQGFDQTLEETKKRMDLYHES